MNEAPSASVVQPADHVCGVRRIHRDDPESCCLQFRSERRGGVVTTMWRVPGSVYLHTFVNVRRHRNFLPVDVS